MVSFSILLAVTVLTVPPNVALLDQSMFTEERLLEPSNVCAVAELDASNDLDAVLAAWNSCATVELRFRK
jgi:hypothetical protein